MTYIELLYRIVNTNKLTPSEKYNKLCKTINDIHKISVKKKEEDAKNNK